jgi:thiamine kinase-like enzyme
MKHLINKLLNKNKAPINDYELISLKGGANNQVFKLNFNNTSYVLKRYFQHKNDLRKRLFAEYNFLNFLWENNIHIIPKPITPDEKNNLAIYSFIDGRCANKDDVNENTINQILDFIISINKNKKKAINISNASESCFSLSYHIKVVSDRLNKYLSTIKDTKNETLRDLITLNLLPKWEKIKLNLQKYPNRTLSIEEKCLSPSDLGFHNVLIKNQKLYFIDFEYAGWDDPAKMICDFFNQPRVPVSMNYFDKFSKQIAEIFPNSKECIHRAKLLFPLYQIKWCLIILNVFNNTDKLRRNFSEKKIDYNLQIELAKNILKNLNT